MKTSVRRHAHIAAGIIFAQMLTSACSEDAPAPPDVAFLSADGQFEIGGYPITIPIVALNASERFTVTDKPHQGWRKALEEQAINRGIPMRVDNLDLSIRQYQFTGEHGVSMQICPRLTRLWAQLVCRGEHAGILRRLPKSFSLVDRAKLILLKNRYATSSRTQYDQIKGMMLHPDIAEIDCVADAKFCTAAVETLPNLIAVWTVWNNKDETAAQMAQKQGLALIEFVRRSIGPIEDESLAASGE